MGELSGCEEAGAFMGVLESVGVKGRMGGWYGFFRGTGISGSEESGRCGGQGGLDQIRETLTNVLRSWRVIMNFRVKV